MTPPTFFIEFGNYCCLRIIYKCISDLFFTEKKSAKLFLPNQNFILFNVEELRVHCIYSTLSFWSKMPFSHIV